jgi:osmotically-inducible protein OsmY
MNNRQKLLTIAIVVCGLSVASSFNAQVFAQQTTPASTPGTETTGRSVPAEHDSVTTSAEHHYNSAAERANDALIITEVKSALAKEGISNGYPVEVDCDHGTVQLSGVVASAADAKRAANLASTEMGVVAVENRLTWR